MCWFWTEKLTGDHEFVDWPNIMSFEKGNVNVSFIVTSNRLKG